MATKIVTKNSSTASAVPTASDLVQGELAVNVADKRLFTEDNGGSIIELGTNPSGNITFQDNGKAIFGAGDDLQIYHDGTSSYVEDTGSGNLILKTNGSNIQFRDTSDNINFKVSQNQTELYYAASQKLATTSTGIDVTGTVSADGIVHTGDTDTFIKFIDNRIYAERGGVRVLDFENNSSKINSYDSVFIQTGTTTKNRIKVNQGGDISFYEDTGTTAKFFWDASAESLGIGTSSPQAGLHIQGSNGSSGANANVAANEVFIDNNGDTGITLGSSDTGVGTYAFADSTVALRGAIQYDHSDDSMNFRVSSSDRMRIDSSGNVGIGTDSPASTLEIAKNDQTNGATLSITNTYNSGDYNAGDVVGTINFRTDDVSTTQPIRGQIKLFEDSASGTTFANSNAMSFSTGLNHTLNERMRIDSSGNVGIGTSSPSAGIHLVNAGLATQLRISNTTTDATTKYGAVLGSHYSNSEEPIVGMLMTSSSSVVGGSVSIGGGISTANTVNDIKFYTAANNTTLTGSERARIDSSGNLLVGTTSVNPGLGNTNEGHSLNASGTAVHSADGNNALRVNRNTSDGTVVTISKDGTTVGSIGVDYGDRLYIGTGNTGLFFNNTSSTIQPIDTSSNLRDDAIDLGSSGTRFKDIYLSGGVYLGGTGAANKLDDYEEGTWTPTGGFDANITSVTYTDTKYTKVGNTVHISGRIEGTVTASGAETRIKMTLPMVASASTWKSTGLASFFIGSGANRISLAGFINGSANNAFGYFYLKGGEVNNSGALSGDFQVTYEAA